MWILSNAAVAEGTIERGADLGTGRVIGVDRCAQAIASTAAVGRPVTLASGRVRVRFAGVPTTPLEIKLISCTGVQFPAPAEPQIADYVK